MRNRDWDGNNLHLIPVIGGAVGDFSAHEQKIGE